MDLMTKRQREILQSWKVANFSDRVILVGFTLGIMGIGILYLYTLEFLSSGPMSLE
jgi:hypothetical protein